MIVAVIILSIMLIGSVVLNLVLITSKNALERQAKKAQKENRESKVESEGLRDANLQLENKIKSLEKNLKGLGGKSGEIANLQAELEREKKENASLKSDNEILKKQLDSQVNNVGIIADQKKRIAELSAELDKLKKAVPTGISSSIIPDGRVAELEAIVEKQKEKINSLETGISKKTEELAIANKNYTDVLQKYNDLQNSCDQLKAQLAGYQTQLDNVQKQITDLNSNVSSLSAEKTELENRNNQLIQQIQQAANPDKALLTQISQLNGDNHTLKTELEKCEKQISQKETTIAELKLEISDIKKQLSSHSDPRKKPGDESHEGPFFPTDTETIQFKDGEYETTLKRLSDVSVITDYLKNSKHEKAQRYLKSIKSYAEEVGDLGDVFSELDADEDEVSSECITKFSKVFNEYMAENVIESVFKAKDEDAFYSELLVKIINYASNCGVYTKEVAIGSKFKKINYMDVITEDTTDLSQHKTIARLLRLPFYAKYTSESGKVREKLLSKGSCVVLKAK